MPNYRFPLVLWEDLEGYHTACVVEEDRNTIAVGATPREAEQQLKSYLAWRLRHTPDLGAPDLRDPRLIELAIDVRPEYSDGRRTWPCNEAVTLRVACLHGRQSGGLVLAVLPTLDLRFCCLAPRELKPMVSHYVQNELKGHTPQQLSRHLPPKAMSLGQIVVRGAYREPTDPGPRADTPLAAVAEPLGHPGVRRQFPQAWERHHEVADLAARLRGGRASVLLVGEPGVGKTTVLVNAVRAVEREARRPGAASPARHRFWHTSAARLIAGMKYLGQWQERCETLIADLGDLDGVLCVENLLDLVRTGGAGPVDGLAAFLLPYLERGELRLVAEATPAELDACRRCLPGLAELCQILNVPAFDREGALAVLGHLAAFLEQDLAVVADSDVVDVIHRLFARFVPYQPFPGKAAAFTRRLFERVALRGERRVTAGRAIAAFTEDTGLPEVLLRDDLPLSPGDVEASFRRHVLGQEPACRAAARFVLAYKAGIHDPHRPVATLLFCGPTGVGKTELAKAIARFFFGHGHQPDRLVHLDMSEYAGPGAADRLLGDPRGEASDLIRKVRQRPFVVLLLDEIEKAAPEVFDLLLGVLDEGRLTDRWGRTTVFRSAVIVMTSNLGAQAREAIGFGSQPTPTYDAEALDFFRPEFYNRIDAVVAFKPLDPATIHAIAVKELREIAQREGFARADIRLTWTDELVRRIAARGFDRRYGARPLQRTLETLIVTPLARHLAQHPGLRDAHVRIGVRRDGTVAFDIDSP